MDQTVFPESQKAAGLHLWKKNEYNIAADCDKRRILIPK